MKRFITALVAGVALAGCGNPEAAPEAPAAAAGTPVMTVATADQPLPKIVVYKDAGCGCCEGWVEHLQAAGFEVDARNVVDLMSIKRDAGVSAANSACHTALIDGYVVEGHVPADVIKRLLAERPDIAGIAVPGMPTGSPGMEGAGAKPYDVLAFDRQGRNTVYTTVDPR